MKTAISIRHRTSHLAAIALASAFALALPGSLLAQEPTALSGRLSISGATAIDPPPNEPRNTHAALAIEGAAAQRLFRTMKAKAEPDACMDKGWRTKFAGPMFCSRSPDGKQAKCFLTVSLIDGTAHSSRAGC